MGLLSTKLGITFNLNLHLSSPISFNLLICESTQKTNWRKQRRGSARCYPPRGLSKRLLGRMIHGGPWLTSRPQQVNKHNPAKAEK